jgi:membrane protein DedA with SNARE-associated domain
MVAQILSAVTGFIIHVISTLGYPGVAILMAIESAAIPLPSEVIMPFSGFLVSTGRFSLLGIALAGGVGSAVGSAILYWIGYAGGRPFIKKFGKYIFISQHDLDIADRFFARYGSLSTFIGRLLPVVRTYISLPAGISRVSFWKFLFYSFVGSFLWSLPLGFIGMKLGQNWENLHGLFRKFDVIIVILIVLGVTWWVWRHIKNRNKNQEAEIKI